MPATKQRIEELMKMERNPLVYLEYTPKQKLIESINPSKIIAKYFKEEKPNLRTCMGYVSRPYESTYRITTCRHLVSTTKAPIKNSTV